MVVMMSISLCVCSLKQAQDIAGDSIVVQEKREIDQLPPYFI